MEYEMKLDNFLQFQSAENSINKQEIILKHDNNNKESKIKVNKETKFKETLKNISENPKNENIKETEKPASVKEISEKINNIKDKIKEMEKNPEISKNISLEKIKLILDKISVLLEKGNKDEKSQIDFGNIKLDLANFLNEILNKISEILSNPFQNQKRFESLLSFINKKLDDVNGITLENKENKTCMFEIVIYK